MPFSATYLTPFAWVQNLANSYARGDINLIIQSGRQVRRSEYAPISRTPMSEGGRQHRWMLRWAAAIVTGGMAIAGAPPTTLSAQAKQVTVGAVQQTPHRITIGPNVQVSAALPALPHFEVLADAHPTDPNRLIACSVMMDVYTSARPSEVAAYTSADGGRHWHLAWRPDTPGGLASDPACALARDGSAYLAVLRAGSFRNSTDVYRAADGLQGWRHIAELHILDRPMLSLDPRSGGRVFLSGTTYLKSADSGHASATVVYRSVPGNTQFEEPMHAVGRDLSVGGIALPDGSFLGLTELWPPLPPPDPAASEFPDAIGTIRLIRFPPRVTGSGWAVGGQPAIQIGLQNYCWTRNSLDSHFPVIAMDRSDGPFRGRLYVAWPGARNGRCEVLFTSSADTGRTWSAPMVLSRPGAGDQTSSEAPQAVDPLRGASMPMLAVNRFGVAGIAWYERSVTPQGISRTVRFAASFDGGATFESSVVVPNAIHRYGVTGPLALMVLSEQEDSVAAPIQSIHLGWSTAVVRGGDTGGLVADASGLFHPVWVDNRTGVSQVWTASVKVEGEASEGGIPELRGWADITAGVAVRYGNAHFDPATRRVTVEVRVTNRSAASVALPMKLRATALSTHLGRATVIDADNHRTGVDAVWDIAAAPTGRALPSGGESAARTLTFGLADTVTLRPGAVNAGSLLDFVALSVKVYGRLKP